MNRINFPRMKEIIRFSLIRELRGSARDKKKSSYRVLITLAVLYIFSGFMAGAMCVFITDPFTAAFISSTLFMVMAGSFILLEYPSLVTGPDDFFFYSTKPVSSATYFFGKLFSALAIVTILFLSFSIPYTVLFFIGRKPLPFLAGNLLSIYLSGIAATVIIITLYGGLVKLFSYRRVIFISSILQFIIIFGILGLNFFVLRYLDRGSFNLTLEPGFYHYFLPSGWYASLFLLGKSQWGPFITGIAALPLLLAAARRFLSMDYAAKLADWAAEGIQKRKGPKKYSFIWRSGEDKVVYDLIKNQFKYNPQFRIGILTIIPLTLLYFSMVVFAGSRVIYDPFTAQGRALFAQTFSLYLAIGFFPVYIKNALTFSSEAECSWIFYTTPASKIKIIGAMRKFILLFFIAPYLTVFALTFGLLTQSLLHTVMHFLVIALLALIETNIFLLFFAELPFTKNPQKGRNTINVLFRVLLALFLPLLLTLFVQFFYSTTENYLILTAVLALLLWASEKWGRRKALRRMDKEEYTF